MGMGMDTGHFSSVRVASIAITPAHFNNGGKSVQDRLELIGYTNKFIPGREQKTNVFRFVAWGSMAARLARIASNGRELGIKAEPESYKLERTDAQGNPIVGADGKTMVLNMVSFTIENFTPYGESAKTIAADLENNIRKENWHKPGHQDQKDWKAILDRRSATVWKPGQSKFGFAEVKVKPNCQLDIENSHICKPSRASEMRAEAEEKTTVAQATKAIPAPAAPSVPVAESTVLSGIDNETIAKLLQLLNPAATTVQNTQTVTAEDKLF